MNPGLRYLARAGFRGFLRRTGRRMRTFRGFVATVLGALLILALLGSQLVVFVFDMHQPPSPERAAQGFGLVLLGLVSMAVVNAEAPFFWPAEVQFLFPAPLGRREMLLYQLLNRGWLQVVSGVWLGTIGMQNAPWPAAAIPAAFVSLVFINVAGIVASLVKMSLAQRVPLAARIARPALYAAFALLAAALYRGSQAEGFTRAAGGLLGSAPIRWATLPLRPFARAFAAQSSAELLLWLAVSAAVVAAAFTAAVMLPVDYREASLSSSARKVAQWQRLRGRGLGAGGAGLKHRRVRVPAFAFLGGAAPLARRHVYELARAPRPLLGLAFSAALAFFYTIVMPRLGDPYAGLRTAGSSLVALVMVFAILGSGALNLDFRRDAERIAYLRSLPLSPASVATGQMFTPAAILCAAILLLLAVAAGVAGGRVDGRMMALSVALSAPAAWVCVGLENWLFLLFPTRVTPGGVEQSSFSGRLFLKMLCKFGLLAVVAALALFAAWLVGMAAGTLGGDVAAGVMVVLACYAVTRLVARAFRGFDLAVDNPD